MVNINNNQNENINNDLYNKNSNYINESDNILNKQVRINSIDRKRADKNGFSNPKRDISAAYFIIRFVILFFFFLVCIFLLKQGIDLYKYNKDLINSKQFSISPVLKEVTLLNDVDFINEKNPISFFSNEIEIWNESKRHLNDANDYIKRDNINAAIASCHESLIVNPANFETLELLVQLYSENENKIEAINSIIRILRINSDREDLLQLLAKKLFDIEDYESVIYMAKYYNENYFFNFDINFFYAKSLEIKEEYELSLKIYNRLNKSNPKRLDIINSIIFIHMEMNNYQLALDILNINKEKFYKDKKYHYNLAFCNAYIGNINETIATLTKASNVFGPSVVLEWINNPMYEKFYQNRLFSIFMKRLKSKVNSNF